MLDRDAPVGIVHPGRWLPVAQKNLVTTRRPGVTSAQGALEPTERGADQPRPGRTYGVVGDEQIHGRELASAWAVSPIPRRKAMTQPGLESGRPGLSSGEGSV